MKIYMYIWKLINPVISTKAIRYPHPTLQKVIDYTEKIEKFQLVEGSQQMEFDTMTSIMWLLELHQ